MVLKYLVNQSYLQVYWVRIEVGPEYVQNATHRQKGRKSGIPQGLGASPVFSTKHVLHLFQSLMDIAESH